MYIKSLTHGNTVTLYIAAYHKEQIEWKILYFLGVIN